MKAIIPVAGSGTRLRPHTYARPKPLVEVAGKPVLGHILDELIPVGVDEVVLVVGSFGAPIVDYVQNNYSLTVHVVEQSEPLGLGHAIYLAGEKVNGNEPVLIVLGDTVFRADLKGALQSDRSQIGVATVDDPRSFGVVEINDDTIVRLVEKPSTPPSNLAIVGVYYFVKSEPLFNALQIVVRQGMRSLGEIQLTDALQVMVDQGEKMGVFPVSDWFDCGSAESLLETNAKLLEIINPGVPTGPTNSVIIPPVYIDPGASVTESVIGPYVSVAEGASVERSIIRNSIINKRASLSDFILCDSVIGEEAKVSGSSVRLNVGDQSEIKG